MWKRPVAALALFLWVVTLSACGVDYDLVVHSNDTVDLSYTVWDSSDFKLITEASCKKGDLSSVFNANPFPANTKITYTYTTHGNDPACQITGKGIPLEDLTEHNSGWTLKRVGHEYVFSLSPTAMNGTGSRELSELTINVSVTFPGEIYSTNGKVNGTTVTWTAVKGNSETLEARAGDGSSILLRYTLYIMAATVPLAVVTAVAMVMVRQRKQAAQAAVPAGVAAGAAVPVGVPAEAAAVPQLAVTGMPQPMPPSAVPDFAQTAAPAVAQAVSPTAPLSAPQIAPQVASLVPEQTPAPGFPQVPPQAYAQLANAAVTDPGYPAYPANPDGSFAPSAGAAHVPSAGTAPAYPVYPDPAYAPSAGAPFASPAYPGHPGHPGHPEAAYTPFPGAAVTDPGYPAYQPEPHAPSAGTAFADPAYPTEPYTPAPATYSDPQFESGLTGQLPTTAALSSPAFTDPSQQGHAPADERPAEPAVTATYYSPDEADTLA